MEGAEPPENREVFLTCTGALSENRYPEMLKFTWLIIIFPMIDIFEDFDKWGVNP